MKICPNCRIDCENPAEVCKNCNYSFIEGRLIPTETEDKTVFKMCPNCRSEVEENFEMCWNCNYSFLEDKVVEIKDVQPELDSYDENILCLRCQEPMRYKGNFKFQERSGLSAFGDLFELFVNKESFDLYACQQCGKVEFFVPMEK
ncbi:MAG: hypothetical protein ACERKD_20855 [Prolixibacteraceae bacterium]